MQMYHLHLRVWPACRPSLRFRGAVNFLLRRDSCKTYQVPREIFAGRVSNRRRSSAISRSRRSSRVRSSVDAAK